MAAEQFNNQAIELHTLPPVKIVPILYVVDHPDVTGENYTGMFGFDTV